jgi:phospholipid transport system transporter-binding protein
MMMNAFRAPSAITFATVEQERLRFLAYCREVHNDGVVIDLENVELCDSAGLAFLIEAKRKAYQQGMQAKIINMPQETRALAKFYGLTNLLGLEEKSSALVEVL